MRIGDILFVHAKFDPVAWLIRKVTKSTWNHVAMAIDSEHILEARGTVISVCHVTKYINWKYQIKLVRPMRIRNSELQEAIDFMLQFCKKRSYWTYLKTIFRIWCFQDYTSRGVVTCSAFIARGFENIGHSFANKSVYLITPDDISNIKGVDVTTELK